MNGILKPLLAVAAMTLAAGTAHAQAAGASQGGGAPAGPGYAAENPNVRVPGDTTERDALAARDAAIAKARAEGRGDEGTRTARAVPAAPGDVTVGSEVFDRKGVSVGKIESVSMSAAVVATAGGKVEVPLEAFGKNRKGLLIAMTKAEFDAAVAAAVKPAS